MTNLLIEQLIIFQKRRLEFEIYTLKLKVMDKI